MAVIYILILPIRYGLTAPAGVRGGQAPSEVFYQVETELSKKFGGFTRERVQGGYVSEAGRLVYDESVLYWTVANPGDDQFMRGLARWAKEKLYQESVLLIKQPASAEFV